MLLGPGSLHGGRPRTSGAAKRPGGQTLPPRSKPGRLAALLLAGLGFAGDATLADGKRNFDIRLSDEKVDLVELERLRLEHGGPRTELSEPRRQLLDARRELAEEVPGLVVIESRETGGPEIVGSRGKARLTGPSELPAEAVARAFVERYAPLYGLTTDQAARLETVAAYTNPAGNLSWVRLRQTIDGLPVFRGELTIGLTPAGEVFRTTGQLATAMPEDLAAPAPQLSAAEAVTVAALEVGVVVDPHELARSERERGELASTFERGSFGDEIRAELLWFPLGRGSAALAWAIVLWGDPEVHYVVVDADDGTLLFRKGLTETAFTYWIHGSYSPAPLSPSNATPGSGLQGAPLPLSAVTVASEVSTGDPWLPSGAAATDGNNVEAGLDLILPDGVDSPMPVTAPGIFAYVYNPPPGNPPPGEDPATAGSRGGAVANLFFWTNRFHDRLYDLGFTEQAGNFQHDNYGRGGVGGDRVRAEAQDHTGVSNANFATLPDGQRPRMQLYLWTGVTPHRDGSLDQEIILHELTHGLSNRLHADATGLTTNMARGLGEGWSDFYALAVLSEFDDPYGVYPLGGYSTAAVSPTYTDNYYYGIRRFPYAVRSTVGGPMSRPHNPLTFADLDATQIDLTDGAYPRGPFGSTTADQVHNAGEIWASALWEARALFIGRLDNLEGSRRMLQLVTDGMKLDPVNPSFLEARDSILAAACAAYGEPEERDLWQGFASRGMGLGAEVLSQAPARVVEAFDDLSGPAAELRLAGVGWQSQTCADAGRNPAPGEVLEFAITLENRSCSIDLHDVGVTLGGSSVAFGTLPAGATATRSLVYTVPAPEWLCGTVLSETLEITSNRGSRYEAIELPIGHGSTRATAFSNPAPISIPAGAPAASLGPAAPYPSGIVVSGIAETPQAVTVTLHGFSHSFAADVDLLLVGPTGQKMIVMSDAFGNTGPVSVTITLDDAAASVVPNVPPIVSGTYRPFNYGAGDTFAPPAPGEPYLDPPLSAFAGLDPNGTWSLWVVDDLSADVGVIAGGWTLGVVTPQTPGCPVCVTPACTVVKTVSGQVVADTQHINACRTLRVGDFRILGPGGYVAFAAGEAIELANGFQVESGGQCDLTLDPSLVP